ncbi:MAG: M50 family metallopeptidase [Alphaproteobacteria bacterium]|nr:M50 family metallopeptidase [Alphaproteobacteria bacterium]
MASSSPSLSQDPVLRRRLGLALAAVAIVVGWDFVLFLPLRVLVVVFHEAGHALTALATGGEVLSMDVGLDEGGVTWTRGGSRLLILNGGYLGSLAAGLVLLRLARDDGRGRLVLGVLGGLLGLAAVLWFRPIVGVGFAYAVLAGVGMVVAARKAPAWLCDWTVRLVGLFSVLYAIVDIRADVLDHGLAAGSTGSDAAMLADATGIPALLWGLGWLVVGGLSVWRLRRHVF